MKKLIAFTFLTMGFLFVTCDENPVKKNTSNTGAQKAGLQLQLENKKIEAETAKLVAQAALEQKKVDLKKLEVELQIAEARKLEAQIKITEKLELLTRAQIPLRQMRIDSINAVLKLERERATYKGKTLDVIAKSFSRKFVTVIIICFLLIGGGGAGAYYYEKRHIQYLVYYYTDLRMEKNNGGGNIPMNPPSVIT